MTETSPSSSVEIYFMLKSLYKTNEQSQAKVLELTPFKKHALTNRLRMHTTIRPGFLVCLSAQLQFQAEKKPGLFTLLHKRMPIPRRMKVVT